MPRGDGTGPMGYGPKTGKGAGFCTDNPERGFGWEFGHCRGFGGGRGRRRRAGMGGFFVEPNPQQERHFLEDHRETLQSQLDGINQRLEELAAQETQES